MAKQIVYLSVNVTYEVNTSDPFVASKKAIDALFEELPAAGDTEDGVKCLEVLVNQNLPIREMKCK